MQVQTSSNQLMEVALRIRELREIVGYTPEEMAQRTGISEEQYQTYEKGAADLPFTFLHKCAQVFGVELIQLLEGQSAKLSSYTVTRKGMGLVTASEDGIMIQNMAALFRKKIATPYYVTYQYSPELQNAPIHTVTHGGQEFDMVIRGAMKIQVGEHTEILREGDSIFYDSSTPHGMIAIDGEPCVFLAMIMAAEEGEQKPGVLAPRVQTTEEEPLLCRKFIQAEEDENHALKELRFTDADTFNFAFDIVDEIGRKHPDKLAMVHVANDMTERRFTFKDIKEASSQAANYFTSLGIRRGDRVMLVLKRHYQFWYAILGLHKIGAVAIPATNQLLEHDFAYRFKAAGVSAIVCTADGDTAHQVELGEWSSGMQLTRIMVGGSRPGWHDFDNEYGLFSRRCRRKEDSPCGDEPMLMFFTSGTTGYPKIATHSYKYALGHYVTAKY